jgi:hypothetical protein
MSDRDGPSFSHWEVSAVLRSRKSLVGLVALAVCLVGCGPGGPSTVPVKGTLTIDGKLADNVQITFAPLDASLPSASGVVKNGAFELFSGVQGKPGAVPGRYKVVLAQATASGQAAAAAKYKAGPAAGASSAPKEDKQELSFPEKYKSATTSDKEVEVKSGAPEIKIEISNK